MHAYAKAGWNVTYLAGSAGIALPPALGLSRKGNLYWGNMLLRGNATSFGVRADGAGGPYLLAVSRDSVLHTLPFAQLLAPSKAASESFAAASGERCDMYLCQTPHCTRGSCQ